MTERLPKTEFSEAEKTIIAQLREKGPDDPEAHRLLLEWCEGEEIKVTATNTSRAGIELDLKKAKLYLAAGFPEEAWSSLEAVRKAAHNEGAHDLFAQAETLMDQIDNAE